MTRDEAIAIRARQLQCKPVDPTLLEEAIATIKATNQPLSDVEIALKRRHIRAQGEGRPVKPRRSRTPEVAACPCGAKACDAEPPVVVEALKPWTLLKPGMEIPDPENYEWPPARSTGC